jgi:hypothetical protein
MNILFYIGVYKDQANAALRLAELKKFYPAASVVSISDGVDDPAYSAQCKSLGVTYILGERLKLPAHAGAWTQRFLTYFLAGTADTIIKIDPDTQVLAPAPAPAFPTGDVFGPLLKPSHKLQRFNGAVQGFTRKAAIRITSSGLLMNAEYADLKYSYQRFSAKYAKPGETVENQPISCQDAILWSVVNRLSLTVTDFPEVQIKGRRVTNPSFIHPAA